MATTGTSLTVDATAPAVKDVATTNCINIKQSSPAPKSATSKSQNGAAKPKPPPPGYKLVRRRKEDGSTITVLRKMTPEELEATGQKEPTTVWNEGVEYKIVTVRNTDGSYVRVKRPVKPAENASPAAAPMVTTTTPASPTQTPTSTDKSAPESKSGAVNPKDQSKTDVNMRSVTGFTSEKSLDSETAPVARAQGSDIDMETAFAEQKAYFRQQRTRKYKQYLILGLGTITGSAVSQMDLHDSHDSHNSNGGHSGSGDIQEGDIIDSDEDWSDDDDTNDNNNDDDYNDHEHNDDNDDDHSNSKGTHVQFDTAGAAKTLITTAATSAANAAGAPPKRPAPVATATQTTATTTTSEAPAPGSLEKHEKITYKVTISELEEEDRRFAEKDEERSIRRHWTNIAFYVMASLILGAFLFPMNGKGITSSWKVMPDIIKVAISAWPIVFAAVVAQVFKAYATWKVESGIKLMRLEQLIGSNSFGSAIKQPMILRQLDVLSLLLLLTWCLSPLGSQALQRSYTTGLDIKVENATIYYLNETGRNRVFSEGTTEQKDSAEHASDNQFTGMQFLSALLPVDQSSASASSSSWTDRYFHPIVWKDDPAYPISMTGIPVILPESKIPAGLVSTDKTTPMEQFDFKITSSYYNFACGDWKLTTRQDIPYPDADSGYASSWSSTLMMKFAMGGTNLNSTVVFNSANVNPNNLNITDSLNWEYSQITCGFEQVFFELEIYCERIAPVASHSNKNAVSTQCSTGQLIPMDHDVAVSKGYGTQLEGFAGDWTDMGALVNADKTAKTSTPTEFFLQANNYEANILTYEATRINLSEALTPSRFADNFGLLFNTWIGIGYCPECQALISQDAYNDMNDTIKAHFVKLDDAYLSYSIDTIFMIELPWAVCFMVCTCLLFFFGVAGVIVESRTVAPDTLGYVSTVVRNSRYLHLKPTSGAMSGPERARKLADTKVMLQDVKAKAGIGKIALGLKSDNAVKLRYNRLYR